MQPLSRRQPPVLPSVPASRSPLPPDVFQSPPSRFPSVNAPQTLPVRFGHAKNPPNPYSAWKDTLQWCRSRIHKQLQFLRWGLESVTAQLKMAFSVVACMFAFLPLPDRWRCYIEQNAFFSPTKTCSLQFLRDPPLQKRISEHYFNLLNALADEPRDLRKVGVQLNPDRDNVRLNAWYIPAKNNQPTVLFHHGRSSNISNLGNVLRIFSRRGYGVMVYDYPGFGRSEGRPGEQSVYNAGLAASRYLQKQLRVPVSQQIMMGYSLGSPVASDLTRKLHDLGETPKALILLSTFPSIRETFLYYRNHYLPWLKNIFKADRIKLGFNTEENLRRLPDRIPFLVLQGEKDTQTSIPMLREMLKRLNRPAGVLEPIQGARHRLGEKDYQRAGNHFFAFMDRTFPEKRIQTL